MIGNVAHDLKTPLAAFMSGMDMIASSLEELTRQVSVLKELYANPKNKSSSCHPITPITPTKASYSMNDLSIATNISSKSLKKCVEMIESIQQSLSLAKSTNSFMLMTINRCIDYTKASKGILLIPRNETINLLDIIRLPLECIATTQDRIKVELQPISIDICSHVITDRQWLQENLLCLLSNAVKYSSDGLVTLSVSLRSSDENEPNLSDCSNVDGLISQDKNDVPLRRQDTQITNKMLWFEVEDHGVGISDDAKLCLFNPFRQAQRLAGGTGLGLYSLAKRVDALKGSYGVANRKDGRHGSLFWFAFPYRPDEIAASMVPTLQTSSMSFIANENYCSSYDIDTSVDAIDIDVVDQSVKVSGDIVANTYSTHVSTIQHPPISSTVRTKQSIDQIPSTSSTSSKQLEQKSWKILLVDDSPMILKMVSLMLQKRGHTVVLAENGEIAVEKLEQEWSRMKESTNPLYKGFDMILMDLQMPVLDGLEATKRIREMEKQSQDEKSMGSRNSTLIIGMSANSDNETIQEALTTGVNGFLSKPFTIDAFVKMVEMCMH